MEARKKLEARPEVSWNAPVRMELKPERIQDYLRRMPRWELREDGQGLERVFNVESLERVPKLVDRVCRLAAAVGQPVLLRVAKKRVVVRLKGHSVRGCIGGLTEPVFKLAELIG